MFDPPPNVDVDAEYAALPYWLQRAIKLYTRCRLFNDIALPGPGGVMDQQPLDVLVLQMIHTHYNEIMAQKTEDEMLRSQARSSKAVETVQYGKSYSRQRRR